MIKNYFTAFALFITISTQAQETFTFSAYDGATATLTATTATATVNDDIIIVFEDVDIINNFYTDGRTYIHMYGGLDTPTGDFQDAPMFSDLASQPQLTLDATDTNAGAPPNTYSITINLSALYTGVADGTNIFGFNLLFQNEFGGGGNNQTVNLYIDLIDALKDSTLSTEENSFENANFTMISNELNIKNFNGEATISAYNILGKQILKPETIIVNGDYKNALESPENQLSFVSINIEGKRKTIKVIQ